MNLINDKWIPVRRRSGIKEKIAPWEVTDKYAEDPIIELCAVRPDFNGALVQFLIGLLQTTCAPQDNSSWRKWLNAPPAPQELRGKFKQVVFAFNLDGDGPRFMQDLTLETEEYETWKISKLLPGLPGIKTEEDNTDLFIKRNSITNLCVSCSAIAIFMAQSYGRSGGSGWRTGLRGSGPATTIIQGENLWDTSWLNVVGKGKFLALGDVKKEGASDRFPWMAKTKTSINKEEITPIDVHPDQLFWQMPWRIRFVFKNRHGDCDVCGEALDKGFSDEFFAKNYGMNYKGIWIHPLTPYSYKRDEPENIRPVNIDIGGIGYRHWLGLVLADEDNGKQPALVVEEIKNRMQGMGLEGFRLRVFGYNMKKDRARCWYESIMPVIFIADEQKWKDYCSYIAMLICAADSVSDFLSKAVVKALNSAVFNAVRQRFWQETEKDFYEQINNLWQDVLAGHEGLGVRQVWHSCLARKAEEIFNDMSQADMIEILDAERVANAWNELRRNLYGKKFKAEILALP